MGIRFREREETEIYEEERVFAKMAEDKTRLFFMELRTLENKAENIKRGMERIGFDKLVSRLTEKGYLVESGEARKQIPGTSTTIRVLQDGIQVQVGTESTIWIKPDGVRIFSERFNILEPHTFMQVVKELDKINETIREVVREEEKKKKEKKP